jgi:hypothetical protein
MPGPHVRRPLRVFRVSASSRSCAPLDYAATFFFGGRPPRLPFSADVDAFFALVREPSSCDAALRTVCSPAAAIISVSRRTPVSAASNHNALPGGSISGRRSSAGATFASPLMRPRGIVNDDPVLSWMTNASCAREYRASTIVVSIFAVARARFPASRISAPVVRIRPCLVIGASSSTRLVPPARTLLLLSAPERSPDRLQCRPPRRDERSTTHLAP